MTRGPNDESIQRSPTSVVQLWLVIRATRCCFDVQNQSLHLKKQRLKFSASGFCTSSVNNMDNVSRLEKQKTIQKSVAYCHVKSNTLGTDTPTSTLPLQLHSLHEIRAQLILLSSIHRYTLRCLLRGIMLQSPPCGGCIISRLDTLSVVRILNFTIKKPSRCTKDDANTRRIYSLVS